MGTACRAVTRFTSINYPYLCNHEPGGRLRGHPRGPGGQWYLANPAAEARTAEAEAVNELAEELLERCGQHGRRIIAQPEFLESLVPLAARPR
jgi:hypothetical protein